MLQMMKLMSKLYVDLENKEEALGYGVGDVLEDDKARPGWP